MSAGLGVLGSRRMTRRRSGWRRCRTPGSGRRGPGAPGPGSRGLGSPGLGGGERSSGERRTRFLGSGRGGPEGGGPGPLEISPARAAWLSARPAEAAAVHSEDEGEARAGGGRPAGSHWPPRAQRSPGMWGGESPWGRTPRTERIQGPEPEAGGPGGSPKTAGDPPGAASQISSV